MQTIQNSSNSYFDVRFNIISLIRVDKISKLNLKCLERVLIYQTSIISTTNA
jgi:hypothetical protein